MTNLQHLHAMGSLSLGVFWRFQTLPVDFQFKRSLKKFNFEIKTLSKPWLCRFFIYPCIEMFCVHGFIQSCSCPLGQWRGRKEQKIGCFFSFISQLHCIGRLFCLVCWKLRCLLRQGKLNLLERFFIDLGLAIVL